MSQDPAVVPTDRLTVFNTPLLTPVLRWIATAIWRLSGWRINGDIKAVDKAVFICVPHTSNWDLGVVLAVVLQQRLQVAWMGKASLFPRPIGMLMRWLGGISIDRAQASNTVEQMCDAFQRAEHMMLVIAPEGTRSRVPEWKMGFYHIALGAGVPIQLAALNGPTKEVFLGPLFIPTGDIERDMPEIMAFFEGRVGINPRHTS